MSEKSTVYIFAVEKPNILNKDNETQNYINFDIILIFPTFIGLGCKTSRKILSSTISCKFVYV